MLKTEQATAQKIGQNGLIGLEIRCKTHCATAVIVDGPKNQNPRHRLFYLIDCIQRTRKA